MPHQKCQLKEKQDRARTREQKTPSGPIWAHLGPFWAHLGPFWPHFAPIWAHMGPGPMGPYGPGPMGPWARADFEDF